MSTIQENLQTIASSVNAIKNAISDKGGDVSGDITTWADAINGITTGGGDSGGSDEESEYILTGTISYSGHSITITGKLNKLPNNDRPYMIIAMITSTGGPICVYKDIISDNITDNITLTVELDEPTSELYPIPGICLIDRNSFKMYLVKFFEDPT